MDNQGQNELNLSTKSYVPVPQKKDPLEMAKDAWNKIEKRGMLGSLMVIAIILAIPLTVFVAKSQQDVRQRAESPTPSSFILPTPAASTSGSMKPSDALAAFKKCFGAISKTPSCTPEDMRAADINQDGVVDGRDYNLLLRTFQKP